MSERTFEAPAGLLRLLAPLQNVLGPNLQKFPGVFLPCTFPLPWVLLSCPAIELMAQLC